jgi:hypothetical protein
MTLIEIDIDRYGGPARPSCLADYLEILALFGKVCTKGQLADLVADRWNLRRRALILAPGDEAAEDVVDAAWSCLQERTELLDVLYPFTVSDTRVTLKPDFPIRESSYVALLSITVAHAYRIDSGYNVEQVFEEIVALGLEDLGLTVGRFGEITRSNRMDFPTSLQALGRDFAIPVDHQAASRRGAANDSGLDVFGILEWGDGRHGRWIFLGQVTCGGSDSWPGKLAEVKVPRWKKFLRELTEPIAFLAVPHHVDKRSYWEVVEGDSKALVDRARLAKRLRTTGPEERGIIDAVLASEFETLDV